MIYDLIVIGGGPAGYLGAERAGQSGLKTLLIEKRNVGGVCLNEGCIPTKTLLYSAKIKDSAENANKYGVSIKGAALDHNAVIARKNKVVNTLVRGVQAALKGSGVTVVNDKAVIMGKNKDGFAVSAGEQEYTGKRLLIATGSCAAVPGIPGLKEAIKSGFVLTSKEMLDIKDVPDNLVIIGGGVIGLEMASYFNTAGADVTVIEMLPAIGGPIDSDIAEILKKSLIKKEIKFKLEYKVNAINKKIEFIDKDGNKDSLEADKVLLSIGRIPNIQSIGLEALCVLTENGAILTDSRMQTNIPGVYAAGDVNGKSMLAHTAYMEAETAVSNMLGKKDIMNYNAIPSVIYTSPEAAGAGITQEQARKQQLDVKVKSITMNYSGRYLAENERGDGIIKLMVDKKWNKLVGVHMISPYASEIIYGASMMIQKEMTIDEIKKMVFPHPTVSEALREAVFQL